MTNENFINGYVAAMLWSSPGTTPEGEEVESLEGYTLEHYTARKIAADCESFINENYSLFLQTPDSYDWEQFGHDFWLTRNHHGAGFWDRGLGEIGEQLTAAAQKCGGYDPYIGDDGKIYF